VRTIPSDGGSATHEHGSHGTVVGGVLYRPWIKEPVQPLNTRLVPYFAWANRGPSTMSVWLPVVIKD
jgi:DUF1680 family protein